MNAAARSSSKKLTPADYVSAAQSLGVSVAAIRAVADVESRGDGFMSNGHPVILFERHVMYRQLRAKFGLDYADQMARAHPDIVNTTSGGYGKESEQPKRMERAAAIDRECALNSASWGIFQLMGYHWRTLGYATQQTFINAMYRNEAGQLHAFCRFIKVDPALHQALKNNDWERFARIYNGPAYAAHNYHGRIAAAYNHHLKDVA